MEKLHAFLLQVETAPTIYALLVTAVTTLAGVVAFLFMLVRSLYKQIKDSSDAFQLKLQEVYKEQIKDNKDVITKNTQAFLAHTEAVEKNSEVSKDLKDVIYKSSQTQAQTLNDLKLYMNDLKAWMQERIYK
jgi:isoleucyl-tRNA synthetase